MSFYFLINYYVVRKKKRKKKNNQPRFGQFLFWNYWWLRLGTAGKKKKKFEFQIGETTFADPAQSDRWFFENPNSFPLIFKNIIIFNNK